MIINDKEILESIDRILSIQKTQSENIDKLLEILELMDKRIDYARRNKPESWC